MGVHDRLDVGPLAVDPDVKARTGVGTSPMQGLEVLVDQHHALRGRFLEAVAELQRPESAGRGIFPFGTSSDLTGEAGLVAFARENPAACRKRLRCRKPAFAQVLGHLAADPLQEIGLVALVHFMRLGRKVEMIGKATRMARRTQSTATNGITPRKMVRVCTCGSSVLRTKRFMPTGGLMRPISTTTTMRMPNPTGSSPICTIRGKKSGTVSRIMESSSIAVPRIT